MVEEKENRENNFGFQKTNACVNIKVVRLSEHEVNSSTTKRTKSY